MNTLFENYFIMIKVPSIHYSLMNQILDNIRSKSDDSTNVKFGSFTVSLITDVRKHAYPDEGGI